jgi:hypothetical protein
LSSFAEFFLSLHVALLIRWEKAQTSFSHLETGLEYRINSAFHLHPHSSVGGYVAFFAVSLMIAMAMFVVLRLVSATVLLRKVVRLMIGLAALGALPACLLYIQHILPVPGSPSTLSTLWLLLELAGAITCSLFYMGGWWPAPAWTGILLLVLHFGLWGWLFLGGPYFWRAPFSLVFPLTGLCCSLAWGLYLAGDPVGTKQNSL